MSPTKRTKPDKLYPTEYQVPAAPIFGEPILTYAPDGTRAEGCYRTAPCGSSDDAGSGADE